MFHAYFNPERAMPAEAEAVHGLSDAFLADKPLFAECAQDFLDFIGDSPMVAHNAAFDFNFINAELALCGLEPVSRERMIDTVALAKVRHPGAKLSLDALCTPLWHRSQPPHQARRAARRRTSGTSLCGAARRPPDRPGA